MCVTDLQLTLLVSHTIVNNSNRWTKLLMLQAPDNERFERMSIVKEVKVMHLYVVSLQSLC